MSEDYTRRDYAKDKEDSVQAGSVTKAVDIRAVGKTHTFHDLYEKDDQSPGHDSDEAAVDGFCGGSRNTRDPQDTADEWAAKFEGYQ